MDLRHTCTLIHGHVDTSPHNAGEGMHDAMQILLDFQLEAQRAASQANATAFTLRDALDLLSRAMVHDMKQRRWIAFKEPIALDPNASAAAREIALDVLKNASLPVPQEPPQ